MIGHGMVLSAIAIDKGIISMQIDTLLVLATGMIVPAVSAADALSGLLGAIHECRQCKLRDA